jgi:hypothetical protein
MMTCLSTGIQPFTILVQTMATERHQAQALVHMIIYDTVMGGVTATVADAQFLVVANDPDLIPLTPGQARTCLTYLRALSSSCPSVVFTLLGP